MRFTFGPKRLLQNKFREIGKIRFRRTLHTCGRGQKNIRVISPECVLFEKASRKRLINHSLLFLALL